MLNELAAGKWCSVGKGLSASWCQAWEIFFKALKYLVKQNHLFHLCPFCSFHSNFYLSSWVKVVICLSGGLRTGAAHLKLLSSHPIGDIIIKSDEWRLQQDKGRRGRKSSDMGKKSVQGIHQNQQTIQAVLQPSKASHSYLLSLVQHIKKIILKSSQKVRCSSADERELSRDTPLICCDKLPAAMH